MTNASPNKYAHSRVLTETGRRSGEFQCGDGNKYAHSRVLTETPWLRIWILAAVMFAASIASIEANCRKQGYLPDVSDTLDLWSFWRNRVRGTQKTIALIGTSRLKAAVSIKTLAKLCPQYRIVQLSIMGNVSPIGTLKDLADDEDFHGLIVCDFETPFLIPSRWNDQSVHFQHRPSFVRLWKSLTRCVVETNLVVCRPELSLRSSWCRFWSGEPLQRARRCQRTFRREMRYHFSEWGDLDSLRRSNAGEMRVLYKSHPLPPPERVCEALPAINASISKLRARGGDVIFVRMPSSGARFALEEEYHSKARYWDHFAAATKVHCVHFRDVPALRDLTCPDDSHLDATMADYFTVEFFRELRRIGALGDRSDSDVTHVATSHYEP